VTNQDRRYRDQGGESYQHESQGGEIQGNEGGEAQDGNVTSSLEAELAGEAETLPMPQPRHVAPPPEDAPETSGR
jgi:hypothetical protein